jgi:hypothetical protein
MVGAILTQGFASRIAFGIYHGQRPGGFVMATVTCDICGGIFSQSYLPSHKRLAHSKNRLATAGPITEKEAIQKIASLYEGLSASGRRRVVRLLTAKSREVHKDEKIQ